MEVKTLPSNTFVAPFHPITSKGMQKPDLDDLDPSPRMLPKRKKNKQTKSVKLNPTPSHPLPLSKSYVVGVLTGYVCADNRDV